MCPALVEPHLMFSGLDKKNINLQIWRLYQPYFIYMYLILMRIIYLNTLQILSGDANTITKLVIACFLIHHSESMDELESEHIKCKKKLALW